MGCVGATGAVAVGAQQVPKPVASPGWVGEPKGARDSVQAGSEWRWMCAWWPNLTGVWAKWVFGPNLMGSRAKRGGQRGWSWSRSLVLAAVPRSGVAPAPTKGCGVGSTPCLREGLWAPPVLCRALTLSSWPVPFPPAQVLMSALERCSLHQHFGTWTWRGLCRFPGVHGVWGEPKTQGQVCGLAEPWLGGEQRWSPENGGAAGCQDGAELCASTRGELPNGSNWVWRRRGGEKNNQKSLSEVAQLPNSWPAAALSPPVVPAMLGQEEPVSQC